MGKGIGTLILAVGLLTGIAAAQAPFVPQGGVVSAASLFPAGAPNYGAAPGGIVSIFGSNLAFLSAGTQFVVATTIPLPTNLGGTSVTIGGINAPLFYVSPSQINAQVPYGVSTGSQPVVVKTTNNGTSPPVTVPIQAAQPGLFAANSNGAGLAAAQNVVVNGNNVTYITNGPTVAVPQGNLIVAYGTGGGALQPSVATGAACVSSQFAGTATATVGGIAASVAYGGCSPTYVGLDQWNITVPAGLPDGCFIPVQVTVGGVPSNVVSVAVSQTGNCNSATTGIPSNGPGVSYGIAFLERVNASVLGISVNTSQVIVNFLKNAANSTASSSSIPPAGAGCNIEISNQGAPTGFGGYSNQTGLDAGTISLISPSGTSTNLPTNNGPGYYGLSPSATGNGVTVAPGTWTLKGSGGASVGAFSTTLNIPQLFSVTSLGVIGTSFSQSVPLTTAWTCPDTTGQVAVQVQSTSSNNVSGTATCAATCSAGTYTMPVSVLKQLPISSSGGAQVLVLYLPSLNKVSTITATGISSGFFAYGDATVAPQATMTP